MSKSLILDTNLAVLLVVGLTRLEEVGKHKRTSSFDRLDFQILSELVAKSRGLIFTPNVLTETSNLLRQTHKSLAEELSRYLAAIVRSKTTEIMIESLSGVTRREYERLGLTDSVLLHLNSTQSDSIILTDDLDLYLAAANDGLAVENFTHYREKMRKDF